VASRSQHEAEGYLTPRPMASPWASPARAAPDGLKEGPEAAEVPGEMTTRPHRRPLAVLACLLSVLLAQPAASSEAPSVARAGESGSGPAPWVADGRAAPRAAPTATSEVRWSDVPARHWARAAIDFVGVVNDWMLDRRPDADGTYRFQPDALESRRLFARALVRAFAPGTTGDGGTAFADMPAEDRFYRWADLVVSNGWMLVDEEGNFRPTEPVTMREVHRAVVLALGMGDLAAGADALHLRNGTPIDTPADFGTTLLGMRLGLRHNHGDDSLDVVPDDPLSRAEVAWSLYRAATAPSWVRESLAAYASMELPNLSPKLQRVVAFAVRYVGYPYVWGGEWAQPTPVGYCCGAQPTGGFDCSGIAWWVMRAAGGGWSNQPPREYEGWALPERSSAQMAAGGVPVEWGEIRPGDLLFYDGNDDGTIDHVNTYLGNGWAVDSSDGNAGVTITTVRANWYEEHFVQARRVLVR